MRALVAPGGDPDPVEAERPKITFRDVGGMEAIKEQIWIKVIHPLANPELCKAYGKPVGGGNLLYGPPGCGKTHIARATAGEVDSNYLAVGIHDVLEMWIGQSERNLHAIFAQARRSTPSVLFFDEVDALGASRADVRGAAGRHVINQFLAELDGGADRAARPTLVRCVGGGGPGTRPRSGKRRRRQRSSASPRTARTGRGD